MLERIYLLFEIVSVLLILWVLHGSRKRPGICTIIYVCLELIITSLIAEGWISGYYLILAYVGIAVVDIYEFGDTVRNAILYSLSGLFFVLFCQMLCGIVYSVFFHTETVSNFGVIIINIFIFISICFLLIKCDIHKPFLWFLDKENISNWCMIFIGVILFFLLIREIATLKIQEYCFL